MVYTQETWQAFQEAVEKKETIEVDAYIFNYYLGVLPPVSMGKTVMLPNGQKQKTSFCFAEGMDYIRAFWMEGDRYFCCELNVRNRLA